MAAAEPIMGPVFEENRGFARGFPGLFFRVIPIAKIRWFFIMQVV
jgi:hypothetical protein